MAGWKTLDGPLGAQMDQVDSSAVFQMGATARARYIDSSSAVAYHGEFIYQKGVASCAAGKWVALNYDNDTVALLPDAHRGPVALAVAATVADTYGWFQRSGKGLGLLAASVADNAALHCSGTAGQAGAAASGLTEIMGARAAAASGSSAANTEVEIQYPVCTSVEPA
jgi:hypothetical protein